MVRWVQGDASAAPNIGVDLVTMTGNVAQAIVDPQGWQATLQQVRARLRRSGRLVFETRDPADEAWRRWTPGTSRRFVDVDRVGTVKTWTTRPRHGRLSRASTSAALPIAQAANSSSSLAKQATRPGHTRPRGLVSCPQ
jgi:hypothetical protein